MPRAKEKAIGVTAFKAKCLSLIEEVASGRTTRVVLTKRGKPVAEIGRPTASGKGHVPDPWGALAGSVQIPPDLDLTAPSGFDLDWDADELMPRDE